MSAIYFVDTDEWINLSRHYPKEIFAGLWRNIESLIAEARILSPKEVLDEIEYGHDVLVECRAHRCIFLNTDKLIVQVQKILKEHTTLVNPNAKRESADPGLVRNSSALSPSLTPTSARLVTNVGQSRTLSVCYSTVWYNGYVELVGAFQPVENSDVPCNRPPFCKPDLVLVTHKCIV